MKTLFQATRANKNIKHTHRTAEREKKRKKNKRIQHIKHNYKGVLLLLIVVVVVVVVVVQFYELLDSSTRVGNSRRQSWSLFRAVVHGRRSAHGSLTGTVMALRAVTRRCRFGPVDKRTVVTTLSKSSFVDQPVGGCHASSPA